MWVAVTQRSSKSDKGYNVDVLESGYVKYFEDFGVKLIPIPNVSQNTERYFEDLPIEAVVLSGGDDINPELYDQRVKKFSNLRDYTEWQILKIAIKRNLPILGICRGMQFINVFFGGKIIQNIKRQRNEEHIAVKHPVKLLDSRLSELLGKNTIVVNSYHDHGITAECLSSELIAFAVTGNGVIEGIYHKNYPIAGIQWHPEREEAAEEHDVEIIEAFIKRQLFWGEV